jgi:hypothetical protein
MLECSAAEYVAYWTRHYGQLEVMTMDDKGSKVEAVWAIAGVPSCKYIKNGSIKQYWIA